MTRVAILNPLVFEGRETLIFRAEVIIDGKRAGKVRNEGRGGRNFYEPLGLEARLKEFCQSIPKYRERIEPVDALIDDLLMANLKEERDPWLDEPLTEEEIRKIEGAVKKKARL